MENLKFKTNIKCSGCIATVTPFLNKAAGENNWEVDLQSPDKILTVNHTVQAKDIVDSLKQAGYQAEKI